MKRRLFIGCAAVLVAAAVLALTGCSFGEDKEFNADGDHVEAYSPQKAKQIGRTSYHEDSKVLWCALSGSGIDFEFYGKECQTELIADSGWTSKTNAARYAVYINGKRTHDSQLTESSHKLTLANPGRAEDPCSIRIIKLSESVQSAIGIGELKITTPKEVYKNHKDAIVAPSPDKKHLIEFIGDSITCGYGIDGEMNDKFSTATEDATKTYACVTAEKLDADYSLVCYSGYGVISGYTSTGRQNQTDLVPKYYDKVGFSNVHLPEGGKIQDDLWDFSKQPDLVVINLGTNDAAYTSSDNTKMREYAAGYTEFLKTVRAKNPNAAIICTLGIMNTTLCDATDLAVMNYQSETGDQNIRFMRFASQDSADGLGIDWHPSAKTNQKASEKLTAFIRDWLKW